MGLTRKWNPNSTVRDPEFPRAPHATTGTVRCPCWRSSHQGVRLGRMDEPTPRDERHAGTFHQAVVESTGRPVSPVVRVVIVDDHALVREGTVQLLSQAPDLDVVGQAGSGEEAISVFDATQPDVALIDINLPGMSGLDLARHAAASHPSMRVLIVSAYDDYAYVAEALDIGVGGYFLKTASAGELVDAVRAVSKGVFVLDRAVSSRLTRRVRKYTATVGTLTRRETEVLELLARGRSNKQITQELGLSLRTVEGHVSNVLAKLGVQSRTEAVVYAVGWNFILPELPGDTDHDG